jgi:hypothetical protein
VPVVFLVVLDLDPCGVCYFDLRPVDFFELETDIQPISFLFVDDLPVKSEYYIFSLGWTNQRQQ